jgi:hypothetical protein
MPNEQTVEPAAPDTEPVQQDMFEGFDFGNMDFADRSNLLKKKLQKREVRA